MGFTARRQREKCLSWKETRDGDSRQNISTPPSRSALACRSPHPSPILKKFIPELPPCNTNPRPTTCCQSENLSLRQVNVGKRTSAPAQARLPWQASEPPRAHILYQAPVPSVGHRKAMAALSGRGVGERTILAASTVWTVNSHSDFLQASRPRSHTD